MKKLCCLREFGKIFIGKNRIMKFTTIIKNKPFLFVKKQFTNKEGKLLRYLTPAGCEVVHHRGLRRGAITKILML